MGVFLHFLYLLSLRTGVHNFKKCFRFEFGDKVHLLIKNIFKKLHKASKLPTPFQGSQRRNWDQKWDQKDTIVVGLTGGQ